MRVHVVATGGTIAMAGALAAPAHAGEELVAALPGVEEIADVSVEQVANVPGVELSPQLAAEALERAERAVAAGARGAVIVQGTDTIEETAQLGDLLWRHEEPVVVTGAMRPASTPSADGPSNLLDAIRVAVSPQARRAGALVSFDGLVHAGDAAVKSHSWRPAAFSSQVPVGRVREGVVELRTRPERRPPIGTLQAALDGGFERRVPIVAAAAGMDGAPLAIEGAEAIVLIALGAGHVPKAMLPAVDEALERGLPVVACARPHEGGTLRRTYGYEGSESDLERRGVILAGDASPWKARIRVLAALALRLDPRELFHAA
ncbi:MAG TPA: asparaginase [Thermoleophilaceae bacterium]